MFCPKCGLETDSSVTGNKYYLGKNSASIDFFKCQECGIIFCINPRNHIACEVERGERSSRIIPFIWGIMWFSLGVIAFWIYGSNIITWAIAAIFSILAFSSIKIGIWGSRQLLDEMMVDDADLSRSSEDEWNKLNSRD